jgi:sarcosine oxidase, subunit gamma
MRGVTAEGTRRTRASAATRALERIGAVDAGPLAQLDVRCSPADVWPLGLPTEPNTVSRGETRDALWLGPDEWLVVGMPGSAQSHLAELEEALDGTHHSVVDVSANRAVIELRSPDRYDLLATGCSIDLHPGGGWRPGRCAQTVFAHAQILLQELDGATRLYVRPSFADYVVERLAAARDALA